MRSLDFNVALVSMPWPILNRPSIQLGALKSFLKADESINVQTFHPYLEVAKLLGPDVYHLISLESWVSEALYGAVLFPEKRDNARALVHKELKNRSNKFNFDTVCQQLEEHINQWIERNDWVLHPEWGNPNLAKPYSELSEDEQAKDRDHIIKAIEIYKEDSSLKETTPYVAQDNTNDIKAENVAKNEEGKEIQEIKNSLNS